MRAKMPVAVMSCLMVVLSANAQVTLTKTKTTISPGLTVQTTTTLPVKKVVLYKNGVGYFEHTGKVHGNADVSVEFTTSQLNDVLKSLAVVDLGGGQIGSIRYNSVAPVGERLKGLQLPLGEDTTIVAFLNALRGTRVDVRSGSAVTSGRMLSVEKLVKEGPNNLKIEATQLAMVTDGGELRTFEVNPATSIRVADSDLRQDVSRYLGLVGSSRSRDLRRMTVSAQGAGDRGLVLSYISEVPVWKSTYRIILPDKSGSPLLQGWAIIDNTVGEDWKDVQLSLVSGAPQSFVQNISQPYYTRRPVVELPQSVMLTPQEHEATMNAPPPPPPPMTAPVQGVGAGSGGGIGGGSFSRLQNYDRLQQNAILSGTVVDSSGAVVSGAEVVLRNEGTGVTQSVRSDANGRYALSNLAPGMNSLNVSSPGFKTTQRMLNLHAGANGVDVSLAVGNASETVTVETDSVKVDSEVAAQAEGRSLGELFEYALKQRITVLKNQSALVPIVQSPIEAEKVTLVSAEDEDDSHSPLQALWLKNTSGLSLDGGSFNIIEHGAFAGEGVMDVLHPSERRLISYAADTAIHVSTKEGSEASTATKITIAKGVLKVTRQERGTTTYTVHNADTTPRDVVVEHAIRENWKLRDDLKPEETSASHYRFKLKIGPGESQKLEVNEVRPDVTTFYVTTLTDTQIAAFAQEKTLRPEIESALRRVLAKKNEIGAVDQQMRVRQQEIESIDRDQTRLRENMKALKGSAEEKALLQRYTHQLDSQEDRLSTLRTDIAGLQDKHSQLQSELDRMVQDIAIDQTL